MNISWPTSMRPDAALSGHEEGTIDADGLIAESSGHFDAAEYQRQLDAGIRGT
jgi:hypothetical protein